MVDRSKLINPLKISNTFGGKKLVRIVALDPGQSTGVADCTLTRLPDGRWQPEITTQTIMWPEGARDIKDVVLGADVVVVEEFRVREKEAKSIVGDRLWSSEATGWVIGLSDTSPIVMQQAWSKEFCSPKMVYKRLGFWPTLDRAGKPIDSHEGDALLHLMYYLSK